ncbi:putative peptidase family-domain-containing protein [Bisporella sp. PMI_857]|nr:putative peptidase family-domain-containing protein [Bisporella sp. PMI_857]
MHSALVLLGLSVPTIYAAPFTLSERAVPPLLNVEPTQVPIPGEHDWTSGYVAEFPIHSSCNATQRHEITKGLEEAVLLAKHAKEHILIHGNKSEIFQKYFGAGPAGSVIGWFDKIATANRDGVLFRCDDPDQNCATQDNWGGHWRGANASSETVICDASYTTRLPLAALCGRGFDIATGKPSRFWGPDLIHRLYHVDLVGEGIIDHHADGYAGVTELAKGENYTLAAVNSATLSYFATEVYAYDISIPGEGCVGKAAASAVAEHAHGAPTSETATSTSAMAVTTSIDPTRVIPAPAQTSTAAAAGQDCHSHDDGTIHCV